MAFLVLLITLIAYKLLGLRVSREFDQWFFILANRLAALLPGQQLVTTLLILLVPIAVAGLVLMVLEDALFGLMGIALHATLLFYSFGRDNLLRRTEDYLTRWREGEVQSAFHYAEEHFKVQEDNAENDIVSFQRNLRSALLYQWFEQIFLVLFWYLLAGPLVALFIRLICLYDQWLKSSDTEAAMPLQLLHVLEWLPVRVLGFTFTIAGNFAQCFQSWLDAVFSWDMPTEKVLCNSGLAALGVCADDDTQADEAASVSHEDVLEEYAEEVDMIQDLVIRSLTVWLVIVAIVAIT